MKQIRRVALSLLVLAGTFLGAIPSSAQAGVSFSFFYDSLGSHGDWMRVGSYGYCWRPRVARDWRPYADGYWTYSDCGWTWVSYEDFGWAVYHYGRWTYLEDDGWVWVPGYDWGPAWVSWRHSDDYVGWAPLPPEARWSVSVGFSGWVDSRYDIGPSWYNFCGVRNFGSPVLRPVIIDRSQNIRIVEKTVNITNITVNKNKKVVYNGGPNYTVMKNKVDRPIEVVKVERQRDVRKGDRMRSRKSGDTLLIPAPDIVDSPDAKPEKIAKVVDAPKIEKGWRDVKDPEQRKRLRKQHEREAERVGGDQASARPFEATAEPDIDREIAEATAKKQGKKERRLGRTNGEVERQGAKPGREVTGTSEPGATRRGPEAAGERARASREKAGGENSAEVAARERRRAEAERSAERERAAQQEVERQRERRRAAEVERQRSAEREAAARERRTEPERTYRRSAEPGAPSDAERQYRRQQRQVQEAEAERQMRRQAERPRDPGNASRSWRPAERQRDPVYAAPPERARVKSGASEARGSGQGSGYPAESGEKKKKKKEESD